MHITRIRCFAESTLYASVLVCVASLAIGMAAIPAEAAPPSAPTFLQSVDNYASYVGQSTCTPSPKPGTVGFKDLVLAAYPSTGSSGISRSCNVGGMSEHKEGRAWDWTVSYYDASERAMAEELLAWLESNGDEHARRFGVMYMIWNDEIWRSYGPDQSTWTDYEGANDHRTHVHFSFSWDGANKDTTWWNMRWLLRNSSTPGAAQIEWSYGPRDATPIAADWDDDGATEPGYWDSSDARFYRFGSSAIYYGVATDLPVAGDWDDDGEDEVGVWRPSAARFYRYGTSAIYYGTYTDLPLVGDWNGSAGDEVGVYRPSNQTFYPQGQSSIAYGNPGDIPISGNWDGSGGDEVGVYRPSNLTFYLRGYATVQYGDSGDTPILGDWDGNGSDTIGVVRLP